MSPFLILKITRQFARSVTDQKPCKLPLRGGQVKSRQTYILRLWSMVKNGKNMFELLYILSGDLTTVGLLKKALQPFMPETQYHKSSV